MQKAPAHAHAHLKDAPSDSRLGEANCCTDAERETMVALKRFSLRDIAVVLPLGDKSASSPTMRSPYRKKQRGEKLPFEPSLANNATLSASNDAPVDGFLRLPLLGAFFAMSATSFFHLSLNMSRSREVKYGRFTMRSINGPGDSAIGSTKWLC